MLLSKEQALERILNTAIRATVTLEEPLSVHVLLMASYDALREYAQAKSIFIQIDWNDYIKEEHQKEWVNEYFKKKFYFLKHGTPKIDSVSFENIPLLNDVQLMHNIVMFQTIFSRISAHMKHFQRAFFAIYPYLRRWENVKITSAEKQEIFDASKSFDRKDVLKAFHPIFLAEIEVQEETKRDCSLALIETDSRRKKLDRSND